MRQIMSVMVDQKVKDHLEYFFLMIMLKKGKKSNLINDNKWKVCKKVWDKSGPIDGTIIP